MNNTLALSLNKISEAQQNKLISDLVKKHHKLEKIKNDNLQLVQSLEQVKVVYQEKTKNILQELFSVKEVFLRSLIDKSKKKSFTLWQRDILSNIIINEFSSMDFLNCNTKGFQDMKGEFQRIAYDELSEKDKILAEEMLDKMKAEMDIPEDFDIHRIHDEEYMREIWAKINKGIFDEQKIEKQEANFENQLNLDLDFKQIYRKMARFCHPDLAKNDKERENKEQQIKKINLAWEKLDYYELIIIWMEIDPENSLDIELTEVNCKKIIKDLNEKIRKEEYENLRIKNEDPTTFYYKNFFAKQQKTVHSKIDKFIKSVQIDLDHTLMKIEDVRTITGLKSVLGAMYDVMTLHENVDDDLDLINEEMLKELLSKL